MAVQSTKPSPVAEDAQIQALKSSLRGQLIRPGDPDYKQACLVYNGMIERYPALIARCVDVADVTYCVNFAREHDITLAVRGGGHNAAGLSTCDDGLVIDLSLMRGIRVDPAARTARVEGGCTWGDVDHATHAFGLATPGGSVSTTGVGGLTLGGGLGYMSRSLGLVIDNLLSVDMVLADGRFVSASADENPDLFWAVRGGGGNFGVVTSFLFRLHPVSTVYGGPMLWTLDHAADALRLFRDLTTNGTEALSGVLAFLTVPPGPPFPEHLHLKTVCAIIWCYTGALDKAEEVFAPIRRLGPPALDLAGPLPYPVLQSMFDPLYPAGLQWYWTGDFVGDLSDEAIDLHVKHSSELPTMFSSAHFYPINGAAGRAGRDETAFSYRESNWAHMIIAIDPDPANNERMIAWAKSYWNALHPYSLGGAYVNTMMEEGQERVQAAYRDNYPRLAEIKKQYDPTNLFHMNQNIKPAP